MDVSGIWELVGNAQQWGLIARTALALIMALFAVLCLVAAFHILFNPTKDTQSDYDSTSGAEFTPPEIGTINKNDKLLRDREYNIVRSDNGFSVGVMPTRRSPYGAKMQKVAISSEESVVDLIYIKVFEDAYWKSSSSQRIETLNGLEAGFSMLSDSEVTNALLQSHQILCIGLVSYPSAGSETEDMEVARGRAESLCKKLVSIVDVGSGTRPLFGVNIGRSLLPAKPGSRSERRQRAVLVVGVSGSIDNEDIPAVIARSLPYAEVTDTDLSKYNLSETPEVWSLTTKFTKIPPN